MIKTSLVILLNGFLLVQIVHANTQVKPPQGPFVSMLRDTYVVEEKVNTYKGTLDTEEKEYNFGVPDLGRYSERQVNSVPMNQNYSNKPAFTPKPIENKNRNIQNNIPSFQVNAFDQLPIESQQQTSPYSSQFNSADERMPSENNQIKSHSFDDLPIATPNNAENNFYPPEWAQPNPLRPPNVAPKNNSQNSMMNRSFPSQRPLWISGTQENNGYQ